MIGSVLDKVVKLLLNLLLDQKPQSETLHENSPGIDRLPGVKITNN